MTLQLSALEFVFTPESLSADADAVDRLFGREFMSMYSAASFSGWKRSEKSQKSSQGNRTMRCVLGSGIIKRNYLRERATCLD